MNDCVDNACFVALVDDDTYSAQLLTRTLHAVDSPEVQFLGDATSATFNLQRVLAGPATGWPELLIVDLKSHSEASLEFIKAVRPLIQQRDIPVVAMIAVADEAHSSRLMDAGAAAVFLRHPEREAYRREVAGIVQFLTRRRGPDAIAV